MAKKNKRQKFILGGSSRDPLEDLMRRLLEERENPGQIQSPGTALTENSLMKARADLNSTNLLTDALDILGGAGIKYGTSLMSQGIEEAGGLEGLLGGLLKGNKTDIIADANQYEGLMAMLGGEVPGMNPLTPVEAEGGEAATLPTGETLAIDGPDHSQGGVPLEVPPGTEFYSKRIKIDGVDLGEREKKRKKKSLTLEELLEVDPTDRLLKNTQERTSEVNALEKHFDFEMQGFIRELVESMQSGGSQGDQPMQKAELGGVAGEEDPTFWENLLSIGDGIRKNLPNPTMGDAMTILSNYRLGNTSKDLALRNRATSTPNINAFENFGQEGIQTLRDSIDLLGVSRDEALKDIEDSRRNMTVQNRGSSRGVNTMRATDIASQIASDKASSGVYANHAERLSAALNALASTQLQRDERVMSGEAQRDLADRQDRGAFFTQLQQGIQDQLRGYGEIGKALNAIKQREVTATAMNSIGKYWTVDPRTGEAKPKPGVVPTGNDLDYINNYDPSAIGIGKELWESLTTDQKAGAIASGGKIYKPE